MRHSNSDDLNIFFSTWGHLCDNHSCNRVRFEFLRSFDNSNRWFELVCVQLCKSDYSVLHIISTTHMTISQLLPAGISIPWIMTSTHIEHVLNFPYWFFNAADGVSRAFGRLWMHRCCRCCHFHSIRSRLLFCVFFFANTCFDSGR